MNNKTKKLLHKLKHQNNIGIICFTFDKDDCSKCQKIFKHNMAYPKGTCEFHKYYSNYLSPLDFEKQYEKFVEIVVNNESMKRENLIKFLKY